MSSSTKGRIKQIRPRTGGSFSAGIPIGTDGLLVDMISQLDLEEEIRLGGNHYVDIHQTETETIIREWYLSQSKGTTPIEQIDDDMVTYTGLVTITNAIQTNIVERESEDTDNPLITWKDGQNYDQSDPTTFGDFIVTREEVETYVTTINVGLYIGNFTREIHHKTIYIYESLDGKIAVDEQVDNINSIYPWDDRDQPESEPTPEPEPEPSEDSDENEPDNGEGGIQGENEGGNDSGDLNPESNSQPTEPNDQNNGEQEEEP